MSSLHFILYYDGLSGENYYLWLHWWNPDAHLQRWLLSNNLSSADWFCILSYLVSGATALNKAFSYFCRLIVALRSQLVFFCFVFCERIKGIRIKLINLRLTTMKLEEIKSHVFSCKTPESLILSFLFFQGTQNFAQKTPHAKRQTPTSVADAALNSLNYQILRSTRRIALRIS